MTTNTFHTERNHYQSITEMEKRLLDSEFDLYRLCLDNLLQDIIIDVCFEVHWEIKSHLSISDIITPIHSEACTVSSSSSVGPVSCPLCKERVAGQRFALHLEKCLNGGKRSASTRRKPTAYTEEKVSVPTQTRPRSSYGSLVVRIRLKDGAPIPQKREAVPFVVFNSRVLAGNSHEEDTASHEATVQSEKR
mmetsp:Transcript_2848/g.4315  ORF Transcript_2848/g.4315 Transcript_2848/m.4315 type:complete len:192 (+) Transcript_2848:161-736(+)